MNVKLELRNRYSELSKTNKQIADFVLLMPDVFLKSTAVDIAKHAQTSSASIIRFVKTLGFSGLEDFKIELARSTIQNEPVENIDPIISKNDDVNVLCEKINSLVSNANEDFFYQLNKDDLEKSIDAIQHAQKIYLLGIGASSLAAYDLYHKLNRANIQAFFNFDAHMTVEFLNYLTPDDVVIAFSYSGQTLEVIYPAEIAKEKGAKVISITRNKTTKLSQLADIALTVPDNEHLTRVGAIASKYTTMLVADLLYLGAIQKNLETIEKELLNTSKLTRTLKMKDNGD